LARASLSSLSRLSRECSAEFFSAIAFRRRASAEESFSDAVSLSLRARASAAEDALAEASAERSWAWRRTSSSRWSFLFFVWRWWWWGGGRGGGGGGLESLPREREYGGETMGERGGRKGRKEGEKEGEKEREKARERKRRKQQRRSVAWLPVVPLSAQHRGSVGGGWVGGWRAEALARETPNAGGPDEEATSGARAGGARRLSTCFSGGNSQQ